MSLPPAAGAHLGITRDLPGLCEKVAPKIGALEFKPALASRHAGAGKGAIEHAMREVQTRSGENIELAADSFVGRSRNVPLALLRGVSPQQRRRPSGQMYGAE
jgi:hypothetical protein